MKKCENHVICNFHIIFTCFSYYSHIFITFFGSGRWSGPQSHIFVIFLIIVVSYYFHIFVKTSFSSLSIRTIFTTHTHTNHNNDDVRLATHMEEHRQEKEDDMEGRKDREEEQERKINKDSNKKQFCKYKAGAEVASFKFHLFFGRAKMVRLVVASLAL